MSPKVTLTSAAASFINRIVRFSGLAAGAGLRLSVTPGGCSGYSSEFSPESAPAAGEQALEVDGVRLFIGAETRMLLDGITIDFVETPTQSGLTFTDPTKQACVCSSAGDAKTASGGTAIDISAISRSRSAPIISR